MHQLADKVAAKHLTNDVIYAQNQLNAIVDCMGDEEAAWALPKSNGRFHDGWNAKQWNQIPTHIQSVRFR